jgi:chromate reductase
MTLEEGDIKNIPHFNEDIDKTPKAVQALAEKINQADGLIFFSPEYNYSLPGVLKNAIDWLSKHELKPFNNKKVAIIGASPGKFGTVRMQHHLRQIGVALNLNMLNKPEVMINDAASKIEDGKVTDQDTLDFLDKHSKIFAEH